MTINVEEKISQYIQLRDHKAAAKAALDESLKRVNAAMEKLEGELLLALQDAGGANSIASPSGTAYRREELSVTVADPTAYLEYLKSNDAWELADVKANKTAIREILDAGTPLPPGVTTTVVAKIGIRRSSK